MNIPYAENDILFIQNKVQSQMGSSQSSDKCPVCDIELLAKNMIIHRNDCSILWSKRNANGDSEIAQINGNDIRFDTNQIHEVNKHMMETKRDYPFLLSHVTFSNTNFLK